MPFFRYAATDAQGKAVQGTVQATTSDEATRALAQRGIQVTTWLDSAAKQAIPAPQSPTHRPQPTIHNPQAATHRPQPTIQSPHPTLNLAPRRTRRGKDKERFFLFTQISSLLKAGVNPHQAFGDMALRMRRPEYRDALNLIAQGANQGVPISDVLEAYPDLFPSHVIGLVRAGEVGGFLPEACHAVAQQAEAAHKFRRSLWMVWVVAIHAFVRIPVGVLAYRAFPRAYQLTEESGASGFGGGISAISGAFWELLKWPVGPAALLADIIAVAIYLWINSRPMTRPRHGWSLRTPILGGRAKNEGLSLFAWVLSKVAQAGVSPHRSWELGMQSVPNLALRDKLGGAGAKLHSGERLSTAMFETKLFPEEYAPMVATGEMTGDVPGMLQRLSDLSKHEFEISTTKSKAAAWILSTSSLLVTGGIVLILIVVMWYYRMPEVVLEGMDVP